MVVTLALFLYYFPGKVLSKLLNVWMIIRKLLKTSQFFPKQMSNYFHTSHKRYSILHFKYKAYFSGLYLLRYDASKKLILVCFDNTF